MELTKRFRLLAFLTTVFSITVLGLPTQPSVALAEQPQPVTAKADKATVRIDSNGSYAGIGVVVSAGGYVLTSVQTVTTWRFAKFTIGEARVAAKLVGYDDAHGLALLQATDPLNIAPVTITTTRSPKNAEMLLISYRQISSEPPMISRRKDNGVVINPNYVGESSGTLELHDLEIVRVRGQEQMSPYGNTPVISAKTGELEGFVIGYMRRYDVSDLLVMPASVIQAFLQCHKAPAQ